jgi:type II secretory pathway component PulJ
MEKNVMKERLRFTLSALMWAVVLFSAYAVAASAQTSATEKQQAVSDQKE